VTSCALATRKGADHVLRSTMFFVRLFQLVAELVIFSMNGFLIGIIATRRLGLGNNMIAIEVIVSREYMKLYLTDTVTNALSSRPAWSFYTPCFNPFSSTSSISLRTNTTL